jgi:uncharacterized membrane protein YozB (DUF420 family)
LGRGFLGTQAILGADLVLLLELAMGLALFFGARLARRQRYRAHTWCQSVVVLLNIPVIALAMLPSFHERVLAGIPAKLGRAYYGFSAVHAVLAGVAEVAALYILLSAGTTLVPPKWRIARYKLWMRTVLTLWWLALLLGISTDVRWYIPNLFRR